MSSPLSAAEIITLRSPETEQVKTILPLLLKELVLNGWVNVHKGKRPVIYMLWGLLLILAIGLFAVEAILGFAGIFGVAIAFFVAFQPKMLLFLTPLGEQKLKYYGPSSPLLVRILHSVAFARPQDYDNCTNKEWRKHLSQQYPDNGSFHRECLLFSLEHKGLVKLKDRLSPVRTPAGDAALAKAEAEIELGFELPRLLREGAPNAAVMAASLGGMLLLVPNMEGYYHSLINTTGFPEMDLNEQQKKASSESHVSGSDSGSTDLDEKEQEDLDSDNGMDWGDNADFLDGDLGDTNDSGIGADSGCGVGSDSSDSGGGDGGGDGGGCGGGCGGD